MSGLSRDEFASLARDYTVVPVWRELLADLTTPVAAFARVAGGPSDDRAFLLESVEHAGLWGRWSFVGRKPSATIISRAGRISVEGSLPPSVPRDRGVLNALEALLAEYRSPAIDGLPPLHGGVVGYLAYDVVREVEHLPDAPPDESGYPDAILSVVGQVAAYDYWRQRVTLIDAVPVPPAARGDRDLCDSLYDHAIARLDSFAAEGARPVDEPLVVPPERDDDLPQFRRRTSPEMFTAAVEVAKEHILAGDVFQVVLSQRFELELDADPFDLYRSLRQVNPSPYMYFLRHPELCVVGSSPEPMVQLQAGKVISRPIAGTRRRGRTDEHDRRMAAELSEHPKERAEHVMLVDLARNDVGRVVEYGSEHVDELMTLERYSHVMHLTSQVSGRLREGLGPIDVLRATFPAGTVSGAPKVRAMEIIDQLEPAKRGPYAGVIGYFDFSGNLDTAITIRTMLVSPDGTGSVQAGAGIVADSDPADEDLECRNKAAALLAAVPGARRMTGGVGVGGVEHGGAGGCLESSAYAVWLDRDVVEAAGEESGSFLQGQFSQDVLGIADGGSTWSWVLSPQGKVDALARVTRVSLDRWLLDTDRGWGEPLVQRLNRFKLRTKVTIEQRDLRVLGIRGAPAERIDSTFETDPCWPGVSGVNLIGEAPQVPEGRRLMSAGEHEAERIRIGFPKRGSELDEKTTPGETGLVARTVSFTKGCYTGQELVARVDSRGGNVPRRLARFTSSARVDAGAALVTPAGQAAGVVTSAATSPEGGWVALGYLKRGVDPAGALMTEDGVDVAIEGLVS